MSTDTERPTPSELTQRTMPWDMPQRPMLWAGACLALLALLLFRRRRGAPQRRAARHLVRDWRSVDDIDDARDLLGSNLPPILKPALVALLNEAEQHTHRWFRQMERRISKL